MDETLLAAIPPESAAELLRGMNFSVSQLEEMAMQMRAIIAKGRDDAEGFGHFFWCITGFELAPYAKEYWIPEMYAAKKKQTGVLLEAFRGSTKSTVMLAFDLFRIGHNPDKSGLVVAANDDAANKASAFLAAVIEYLPGWKMCFPEVVPDKTRGWGAQGYFIKRTDVEYDKWVEMTVKDHGRDPSFVAAGITSSDIVGMHPSNFLHIDDVHDERNTASQRERDAVIASLRKNLLPTMSRPGDKPFIAFAYTPWVEGDAYQMMEQAGVLTHIRTPLYEESDDGEDFDGKTVRFAWRDAFGKKYAEEQKAMINDRATFALMFLLDREGAVRERFFKWYTYPAERVNMGWPLVAGVDYASVRNPTAGKSAERSHFAMCYALKSPEGYVVIADGVLEQCSQLDAEEYVIGAQRKYVGYLNCVIETDGKGEEFFQLVSRHPQMKAIPKSTGGKNKADRLYKLMSGWLELGKVRISTADTKYLHHLRRFLDRYPNFDKHAPEWDAADALYYALLGMPDMLVMPKSEEELREVGRKMKNNPFMNLAKM